MSLIAFSYFGGKQRLAPRLISLFPPHGHYIEPFAGSLAVLLNKPVSPIETVSDLNGDIVNFFRVLRDQPDQLVGLLTLTPYARGEFEYCWQDAQAEDPIERARRFFVRVQMDISKTDRSGMKSWSKNKTHSPGAHNSAVQSFYRKIDGLTEVSARLRTVQIENRSALHMITTYDHAEAFFYCDPPYLHDTRTRSSNYQFEMTQQQHRELADALTHCAGRVMLSGYDSPLYRQLYPDWIMTEFPSRQVSMSGGNGRITREVIWTNYQPESQLSLI